MKAFFEATRGESIGAGYRQTQFFPDLLQLGREDIHPPVTSISLDIWIIEKLYLFSLVLPPGARILGDFLPDHRDMGGIPLGVCGVILGNEGSVEKINPGIHADNQLEGSCGSLIMKGSNGLMKGHAPAPRLDTQGEEKSITYFSSQAQS